jgi:SIR2-like domain
MTTSFDGDSWRDWSSLKMRLARDLVNGRAVLSVGAGFSMASGGPSWTVLVDRLCKSLGAKRKRGETNEVLAGRLYTKVCYSKNDVFNEHLRNALYLNGTTKKITSNAAIEPVFAIVSASRRRGPSIVISYNFDDALEVYLRSRGMRCISQTEPYWIGGDEDVIVIHPHGFLPRVGDVPKSKITFTAEDFDREHGRRSNWHERMVSLMASSTVIFWGLSGNDANLMGQLSEVHEKHPTTDSYWGIRFSQKSDARNAQWDGHGVMVQQIRRHSDIRTRLWEVCEAAGNLPSR